MPTAREFAGGKLSFHRLYISRQWEARNRKIIGVPPFPQTRASSRSDPVSRDPLSLPPSFVALVVCSKKNIGTLETPRRARGERERERERIRRVTGSNAPRRTSVVRIPRAVNPRRRLIRFPRKRRRSSGIGYEVNRRIHKRARAKKREAEGRRATSDFHGNSVSRAFSCCKSSPKPGSNNGPSRDIQPLGALACISIRYPFPEGM